MYRKVVFARGAKHTRKEAAVGKMKGVPRCGIKQINPDQRMALYSADPPRMPAEVADVTVLAKPVRLAEILKVIVG
jgi:hypothetical protein